MTNSGIRRWLGVAIVPLTLLMLCVASPAQADHLPPTHKCDGDPNFPLLNEVFTRDENNPESGRIIVLRNDGQDCVISANDIHAELEIEIRVENGGKLSIPNALNIRSLGGTVTLTATGNDIDAPNADIKSETLIDIQAGVEDGTALGSIDTKDVISNFSNVQVGDANILIRAQADLSIGKVKTNGDLGVNSQRSGNVQIDANLHPANNGDISIGAGGSIEEIDIRSLTGGTDQNGLPSPFKVEIGMRVENGSDNSTGNITVSDLGAIKVTQSQSRSGRLELNANKGELILGSGTLDASQTDFGGGNIYLFGEKVTFSGAATIDNSQSDNAPKTARQIIIAASEIDYGAGNLSIFSDGSGLSDNAPATVYFLPSGGIISSSTDNVLSLEHSVQFNGNFFFFPGQVHFNGGAGSDLTLRADGEHIQVAITGDNIVFDGKDVTVQARGRNNTKHEIVMGFFDFGSYDGTKGLQMNNTGVTLFNVRGFGGPTNSGGDIQIQVDKSDLNVGRWNLRANAGANVGDGGTILYTTSEMILSPNTLVDFEADAALNGVGNAQILRPTNGRKAIFLNAGNSDLILGRNKEKIQMSANGGGQGGNGGAIEVVSNGEILMDRSDAVTASVRGPDGFGGQIKIDGDTLAFSNPNGVEINVDGGMTSGNGGVIELLANGGTLDVDGTATGVKVSAKAPGDGNGGLVVFDGIGIINIDAGNINVSSAGEGQGGNLFVLNNEDTFFSGGEILAKGSGDGKGGTVFIDANNEVSFDDSTINANGGDNTSDGGTVTIIADALTAQNGLMISADAGTDGTGGTISLTLNGTILETVIGMNSDLTVAGGSTSGPAGNITINTEGKLNLQQGAKIEASGIGTDPSRGGNITITTQDLFTINDGKLIANSSMEGELAGFISVNSPSIDFTDGEIRADGDSGRISIIGNAPGDFTFTRNSTDPDKGVISADSSTEGTPAIVAAAFPISSEVTIKPQDDLILNQDMIVSLKGTGTDSDAGDFTAEGKTVTLNAKVEATGKGTGKGGTITIKGSTAIELNSGNIADGLLVANGGIDGDGGVINLDTGANLELDVNLFAKGGTNSGNGGQVEITSSANIFVFDITNAIDVSAPGTTGNGGFIKITGQPSIIFPSVQTKTIFNAKASTTSGDGGIIELIGSSTTFPTVTALNVNTMMKVDGDSSPNLLISDGRITINTIMCRQFKTAFDYPQSFWDCGPANGSITGAGSSISVTANSLPTNLKNILKDRSTVTPLNDRVQIYAMRDIRDFDLYFNVSQTASGVYGISNNPLRVSAAFVSILVGGAPVPAVNALPPANAGSATMMNATIIHELGHHLDYIWGNISTDVNNQNHAAFNTARVNDFTRLLNSGACTNAFTVDTCNANVNVWPSLNNLQRYGSGDPNAVPKIPGLGYPTQNFEALPIVFQYLEGVRTNGQHLAPPDLVRAVQTQFTELQGIVQGYINNPPQAVN